jgi:hypothetical protein
LYCRASGQQINRDKSSIFFSKRCPGTVKEEVKNILHVQSETLNEKYLGMPSDVGRSKSGAFKYLKDRVWKKIQGWLERLLSARGGKMFLSNLSRRPSQFFPWHVSEYQRDSVSILTRCCGSSGGDVVKEKGNPAGFHGEICVNPSI